MKLGKQPGLSLPRARAGHRLPLPVACKLASILGAQFHFLWEAFPDHSRLGRVPPYMFQ